MFRAIFKGIIIGVIIAIALSPVTVHAETPQERWIRIQKESNEEFMKGVEADGNLTAEAEEALSWNKKKTKTNKSKTETKTNSNTNTYTENPRGWVYGTDELHITGLPTDERGYTRAGNYGEIKK